MKILNIDAYRIYFHVENLLRDYICKYLCGDDFLKSFKEEAEKNASANGVEKLEEDREYLDWLNLGQLIDIIKSRRFKSTKHNDLHSISLKDFILTRNNIMHTRVISSCELNDIKQICNDIFKLLEDSEYIDKWNKFIAEDISDYDLPKVFIEYPLGVNFKRLVCRDSDLKQIKIDLNYPMPISIVGPGGLGKTAIVQKLITDLMFIPSRPFDNIYFMSFKDSVFEDGKIHRLKTDITNHSDLIYVLAKYVNIDTEGLNLKEIESKVFDKILSTRSLLILDNLETEIVQSNLKEFIDIAYDFTRKSQNGCRLLITSRYGLGDKESKYPLKSFNTGQIKELLYDRMEGYTDKLDNSSPEDWKWIKSHTRGNPGLIIDLSRMLKMSPKSIMDLRTEYNVLNALDTKDLRLRKSNFLEFCFENTIGSMPKDSQIFLSCLCHFCEESRIYSINNELLQFIQCELKLHKDLKEEDLRPINFENINFIQKDGSSGYIVNELVIDFMNSEKSNKIFNVSKLRKVPWYSDLKKIISNVNYIQSNDIYSLNDILAKLYQSKYEVTKDNKFLIDAFLCKSSLDNLYNLYSKSNSTITLNHFHFLDKVKFELLRQDTKKEQNLISYRLMISINSTFKSINRTSDNRFRRTDLEDFFKKIETMLYIFRNKDLNEMDIKVSNQVCKFLVSVGKESLAEKYLPIDFKQVGIRNIAFQIFSKRIGALAYRDTDECKKYIDKCNELFSVSEFSDVDISRFQINLSRYYLHRNMSKEAFTNARVLEKIPRDHNSVYSAYMESLLIRAECIINNSQIIEDKNAEDYIKLFEEERKCNRYAQIWENKRCSLNKNLDIIKSQISKKQIKRHVF